MSPSSGSANLLELLTELKEAIYCLLVYCKDMIKDTDEHPGGRDV